MIITDRKSIIKHSGVLTVKHSGVLTVKLPRYEPRFKYIRSEKIFNQQKFIEDISRVPFSVIYAVDDPNTQLDIFNDLFKSCLNEHVPLKKGKMTRPPAPWMQDNSIQATIKERNELRHKAHRTSDPSYWKKYRELRNLSKKKIRGAKINFFRKLLSSNKSKEV